MQDSGIRRTRSGCTTCRQKRRKCDEKLPRCSVCVRLDVKCDRRQNIRFKHSTVSGSAPPESDANEPCERITLPTALRVGSIFSCEDPPTTAQIHGAKGRAVRQNSPRTSAFVDAGFEHAAPPQDEGNCILRNSIRILLTRLDSTFEPQSNWPSYFSQTGPLLGAVVTSPIISLHSGRHDSMVGVNPLVEDLANDTSLIAPSIHPSTASEPSPGHLEFNFLAGLDLGDFSSPDEPHQPSRLNSIPQPFTSDEEVSLLRIYLEEPGPWIEACDSERHFTVMNIPHMIACPPFRSAALALASRFKHCTDTSYSAHRSLDLYQKAVRELIRCRPMDDDTGVLAAAVLLFVYEMMTVSDVDWRRHLQGCAGLFLSNTWNGSTKGLIGSCFWAYVRSGMSIHFYYLRRMFSCGQIYGRHFAEVQSRLLLQKSGMRTISTRWSLKTNLQTIMLILCCGYLPRSSILSQNE